MKARKKLIPTIALLLFAAIVASTASYAWFTINESATATNMGFTLTAPDNLLVCNTPDGVYNTTVSVNNTYLQNVKLNPVSSIDGVSFFSADSIEASGRITAGSTISTATLGFNAGTAGQTLSSDGYHYIDYVFYIKTYGSNPLDITFNRAASQINAEPNITNTVSNADKSVRVAVVSAVEYVAGTDKMAAGAKNIFAEDNPPIYFDNAFGPLASTTQYPTAGKGGTADTNVNNDNSAVFAVPANETVVEVTLRVWMEGQSTNCISEIAADKLDVSICFAPVAP